MICYFKNNLIGFEFKDLDWKPIVQLKLIKKQKTKSMLSALNTTKKINLFMDYDNEFHRPFLWNIKEEDVFMLFNSKVKINELAKYYEKFLGDVEIYK